MFNSKKRDTMNQEERHCEYKVRSNGTMIQKTTDAGYNYMKIKNNPALDGLEGADDYRGFTTKDKRGNLIYKFEEGKEPVGFNFADNANKEARAAKRAGKGRRRRGTAFTLHDDDVADKVFRAIAGNSNVEYGRIRYNEHGKAEVINYIETDKSDVSIVFDKKIKGNARDIIHSHPFGRDSETGETNSKFPSKIDKDSYNEYKSGKDKESKAMPKHSIYHPVTPDSKIMPYYMPYNGNGAYRIDGYNIKGIDKDTEKQYEKLYQDKYFGQ